LCLEIRKLYGRSDHAISAQRPDIINVDGYDHSAILLDIAVHADINIVEKELRKFKNTMI